MLHSASLHMHCMLNITHSRRSTLSLSLSSKPAHWYVMENEQVPNISQHHKKNRLRYFNTVTSWINQKLRQNHVTYIQNEEERQLAAERKRYALGSFLTLHRNFIHKLSAEIFMLCVFLQHAEEVWNIDREDGRERRCTERWVGTTKQTIWIHIEYSAKNSLNMNVPHA